MSTRPDALLLTGDLVDHGTADEYQLLRELLDFADIVADYRTFAARLRSGEGLAKDGFGM